MFLKKKMIYIFLISIIIPIMLILLNSVISVKSNEREKVSAFECGYDPKTIARMPFSLHFFLIAMIFLVFDVEIALIMPLPLVFSFVTQKTWLFINMTFIMILILGTVHEWNEGSLDWSK